MHRESLDDELAERIRITLAQNLALFTAQRHDRMTSKWYAELRGQCDSDRNAADFVDLMLAAGT
jgi:hypothetical protein